MGRRSMLCSGSLVLLFAGCVFVSMAAAQHGNSASPGTWTTAALSVARAALAATSLPNDGLAIFAGGGADVTGYVNTVDIFNATSGVWTTAELSVARGYLAATSLPNDGLAIFAGGDGAS